MVISTLWLLKMFKKYVCAKLQKKLRAAAKGVHDVVKPKNPSLKIVKNNKNIYVKGMIKNHMVTSLDLQFCFSRKKPTECSQYLSNWDKWVVLPCLALLLIVKRSAIAEMAQENKKGINSNDSSQIHGSKIS